MLHSFTTAINLLSLMVALWLGLYLVTRSPHRPETWLAALALWSMGGYFLNQLLALNPPPTPPAEARRWLHHLILFWPRDVFELGWQGWLQGWLFSYSVIFWYHATLYMLPGRFHRGRLIMALAGYASALAGILLKVRYHAHWINPGGDPLYNSALNTPLFPLFGIGFVTFAGLSTLNLARTMRASPQTMPREQFRLFICATVLGGATGIVGIASYLLEVQLPQVITAFLLLGALILTGIGVARYNALLDRRPLQRDFLYSAAEAGAILLVYMLFHRLFMELYPLPAISFVFVGCLAVITHLLIDVSRHQLDRLFLLEKNRQLRLRLRQLSKKIARGESSRAFEKALEMIGATLPATWLLILRFTPDEVQPVASWNWQNEPLELVDTSIFPNELYTKDPIVLGPRQLPPPFEQTAVIVPLIEYEQTGVLLAGTSNIRAGYTEVELLALQDAGEIIANLLRDAFPQPDSSLRSERAAPSTEQECDSGEILPRLVELGLRNLHDYAYLSDSPLANLRLVERSLERGATTHIERGKAVSALLEDAVARLRPDLEEPCDAPSRTWYPYIILRDAYLDGEPNRDIMTRLYISEGTFNRTRRAAIGSVARLLAEMESDLD